jgi:hypothetical protein
MRDAALPREGEAGRAGAASGQVRLRSAARRRPEAHEEKHRVTQAAIARIWRGRTRRDRADEYEAYNYEAGIKPLIEMALAVQTFREDLENETEFVTISYWESIEAMSEFTSSDPFEVHHLGRDQDFLIELPRKVQILRLRHSHGVTYAGQRE